MKIPFLLNLEKLEIQSFKFKITVFKCTLIITYISIKTITKVIRQYSILNSNEIICNHTFILYK